MSEELRKEHIVDGLSGEVEQYNPGLERQWRLRAPGFTTSRI